MKAIILAAGVGRRLGVDHPKCLLEFAGRSLLQRHLDCLVEQSILEIHVVVGHLSDQIEQAIQQSGHADKVRTTFNPAFAEGSVISLASVADLIAGEEILLMDADVLYSEEMLSRLIDTEHANAFLLDRDFEAGDEPVKLCVNAGVLVEFRKQLAADLVYEFAGESVGFFHFSPAVTLRLAERVKHYVNTDQREEHYEEAIRDLMLETPEEFAFEDVTGIPWLEIDFPEDVTRAEETVLPKILT